MPDSNPQDIPHQSPVAGSGEAQSDVRSASDMDEQVLLR